jgi:carbon monoxide dehydrogenase subunit G
MIHCQDDVVIVRKIAQLSGRLVAGVVQKLPDQFLGTLQYGSRRAPMG